MFSSRKTAAPAAAASGYTISKSLRFRQSASPYLIRSPGTPTAQNTWTLSVWVKRGAISAYETILSDDNTGNGKNNQIQFKSDNTLLWYSDQATGNVFFQTNAVYRDPSAWYHIVLAVNSGASGSNKIRLYINGSEVTSFSTDNRSGFSSSYINASGTQQLIGAYYQSGSSGNNFGGYMAELNFVDGQQLTPTSFGSTNSTTGVWQPIAYTGTYGTNGYYLKFTDTSSTAALGTDYSGNSNTWTVNNISLTAGATYDSMTDVPTLTSATVANYCTWNPLATTIYGVPTFSNGNLTTSATASGGVSRVTIYYPPTGKFYSEFTVTSGSSMTIGIANNTRTSYIQYVNNGNINNTTTTLVVGASYTTGDVIGMAVSLDGATVAFYKNNALQGTINFSSGSMVVTDAVAEAYCGGTAAIWNANFGQQPFTYTPPSGYVALNTYNLPTSTITNGRTVMDATTYTGNGGTITVNNSDSGTTGFKPDLVWCKDRTSALNNILMDSVRGGTQYLISNSTAAEGNGGSATINSFNTNGFTAGNGTALNTNGDAFVAWQWQAGQGSTSSNTNGSITSTVSVNATAGFSIVSWTATGSVATVGHGLGAKPSLIITKQRSTTGDWAVLTDIVTGTPQYMYLNTTQAIANTGWGTNPTSTVFSGYSYPNGQTIISYCWAPVAGFSQFGSYTGNGSADGPFVYTGFRPKFILTKLSSGVDQWYILDSTRNTYNVAGLDLAPNQTTAEVNDAPVIDFLSNGYKLRCTYGSYNGNGSSYIYAAFAENPFKYALAR